MDDISVCARELHGRQTHSTHMYALAYKSTKLATSELQRHAVEPTSTLIQAARGWRAALQHYGLQAGRQTRSQEIGNKTPSSVEMNAVNVCLPKPTPHTRTHTHKRSTHIHTHGYTHALTICLNGCLFSIWSSDVQFEAALLGHRRMFKQFITVAGIKNGGGLRRQGDLEHQSRPALLAESCDTWGFCLDLMSVCHGRSFPTCFSYLIYHTCFPPFLNSSRSDTVLPPVLSHNVKLQFGNDLGSVQWSFASVILSCFYWPCLLL